MKLLIDLSYIEDLHNGVALYAFRILKGMRDNGVKDICLFLHPKTADVMRQEFPSYEYVIAPEAKYSTLIPRVWFKLFANKHKYKQAINQIDCDIIFSPFHVVFYYWKMKQKQVRTIHDLFQFNSTSILWKIGSYITIPRIIKRADAIITISDYVKEEIKRKYPFAAKKNIKTIYNAAEFGMETHETRSLFDFSYILYVNSLAEYKNLLTLLKAFEAIKHNMPHKLVFVGKETPHFREVLKPYIDQHGLADRVVHLKTVSDEELMALYQHTTLFVTPSLLEGFGFTPIEAALCNAPVISTKETALYETTKGLLNYYEPPMDHQALATKIMEVLQNPPSQKELEKISTCFREEYNNRKIAREVYEFITSVHEG
ncbi:glycosyltransferase involved in cell wall biosynthesis [Parabacteroides sp. PFB2-10]|uniref:glycosyltransferase family 4 protein n=1 Tax=Parabacteroides sp. PFB2-10 TaxID=1742405 RepID=UPI00247415AF|nr:glycosyltransferase family 1 protein [Parabacteroides sp. PFB2-10]MDH6314013.1 glycosyltransferase involved in cell wall biosynthesis [Parabacteroides sp. PFB2-10]MDL2244642.1 glycosyltransferase family 4 protein [Parabacteroides sp. OttesenSCG-928-J18]